MEQGKTIRKRPTFAVTLGIVLLLTFVSITLILAKGLDSNRFLNGVTWPLVGLPVSLVMLVFVGFDFYEHTSHPEDAIPLCPIVPKEIVAPRRYAFLAAVIGALLTIVLFFVYNNNASVEPVTVCLIYLIALLPPLLVYVLPLIPYCFKNGHEGDGLAFSFVLGAAVLATGLLVYGLIQKEPTYLVSYIVFPIDVFILMLYKRGD